MTRNVFLTAMYGAHNWKDLKKDFIADCKRAKTIKENLEVANKWNVYVWCDSPVSTIKGRVLQMRKDLLSAGFSEDSPILNFFTLPTEVYKIVNHNYNNKIVDELSSGSSNEFDFIKFVENNIQKLEDNIKNKVSLSKSNNANLETELFYQKIVVLALATGRRQIEILKTLEITKKKELAIYSGLAKKKNDEVSNCEAPILIDINKAKKYLKEIREYLGDDVLKDTKFLNSKYNNIISNATKRYVDLEEGQSFHFFRSAYAKYCYLKLSDKTIDENIYTQTILGHEVKINAGHSYMSKSH